MLIDHAPAVKGLRDTPKRGKKKILWLLIFSIVVMLLFFFACLNLNLFREQKAEEALPSAPVVVETTEPAATMPPEPLVEKKTVSVSSGDTLIELLTDEGLDRTTANTIITTLKEVFNPRQLRRGQEITLAFEIAENGDQLFRELNLKLDVTREIRVTRLPDNSFTAKEILCELNTKPVLSRAEISSSLYNAAIDADMPIDVLIQMIRAYSYDVDFQRDIQPGDKFEALYEKMLDENGDFVKGGSILYASLQTSGNTLSIYRYETSDGEVDLYDENGKSVRKTLMVTPIDGARLSSRYGMRKHPILGYSRMHKGLDFAAPTGTPIMAAGDGVVEYAGRKGGYGKYIRIRHANEYKTAYGHMSRFASGIRKGVRIKQGQIIGYVGSTGVSTGPHLHYEVLHRGKSLNPSSVKTPPGRTLKGEELNKFLLEKKDLEKLYAALERKDKLAVYRDLGPLK